MEDYIRDTTTNWFYNQFKIFPEHEMARESTLEEFTLAKFNKFNICFQIYWKKREPFKICGRGHKSCNKEQMTTFAQNVAETFSSATKQSASWGIVLGVLILFPTIPIYSNLFPFVKFFFFSRSGLWWPWSRGEERRQWWGRRQQWRGEPDRNWK